MILADAFSTGHAPWTGLAAHRAGPAWLLPALMLLLFTIVGGME